MRTRALEAYWAGFTSWWLARMARRWRRTELGDRLTRTALDVGTALVADRHAPAPAELARALDQLGWLVGIGLETRFLSAEEGERATTALDVVREMSRRSPAPVPRETGVPTPTPPG